MKTKNSVDWIDSQGVEHNIDTELAAKVAKQFTDINGAINYIGGNVGTLEISEGTHIFTNCTGTINYSGTTAKVYIVNSPALILNGKTAQNWRNISVDGLVSYDSNNLSDIPFFINNFITGGNVVQIDTSNIANFNSFRVFTEIVNNGYSIKLAVEIKDDATIIAAGEELTLIRLVNYVGIGIATRVLYNVNTGVEQIYGGSEFATGTTANNIRGKMLKVNCV